MLPKVNDISFLMGCDPEFFFRHKDEVIGAEKILPSKGLIVPGKHGNTGAMIDNKFIIDGVQAELNPRPSHCRANLANEIVACFKALKIELEKHSKHINVDFSRTVEISKEQLMTLDEKSRKFGCAPSLNISKSGANIKDIDPEKYRTRAAGGHIHIGHNGFSLVKKAFTEYPERCVEMLDIICGNTCVLVDRDEGNIERRKVYGRAGEYRLPKHGLEYRTLSNFWLTSYPLMSMAFGLARLAVQLMADTNHKEYYKAFTNKVKLTAVHAAINQNDFDIAMANFNDIKETMLEVISEGYDGGNSRYSIHKRNIKEFHYFVDKIQSKGLEYWFKKDPMTHWTTLGECHAGGFHDFLADSVKKDMNKNPAMRLAVKYLKVA